MGLTVLFIVLFGVAGVIPAVWSIVGLAQGNTRFWPGVVGVAWAVALMIGTLIGIATHWGGCPPGSATSEGSIVCADAADNKSDCKPDVWLLQCHLASPGCTVAPGTFCPSGFQPSFPFCENVEGDALGVKQPWATWSDLSFIAAGLWLLWFFHFFARPGTTSSEGTTITTSADNPMIVTGWLSVAYGLITIFMGPPSMWFHASLKEWAGWFDSMSVVIWLAFNAVYVCYALAFAMWDRGRGPARTITVLCVWAGLVVGLGALASKSDLRLYCYFIAGGLWGVAEVIYVFVACFAKGVKYRRTWWLFLLNFLLLAGTMTLWMIFHDGIVKPSTCRSREGFPGHALFHILASFSTILTFLSFASEKRVETSS